MRGATLSGVLSALTEGRSAVDREKDFWEQHEEFDWRAEVSKRDVVQALPALRGEVLELCIGSGMLTEHVPRTYSAYVGLDLSRSLLRTVRRRFRISA